VALPVVVGPMVAVRMLQLVVVMVVVVVAWMAVAAGRRPRARARRALHDERLVDFAATAAAASRRPG